jgi:molybdopterin-synthase adenylyltransferase
MHEQYYEYGAAMSEGLHEDAIRHLIRPDGQEDLCFALWHPSKGARRLTGLVYRLILPENGERDVHGNASFMPLYFDRALDEAIKEKAGLAFLHSHPVPGWQGMSRDDVNAEFGHAGAVVGATGLPFLGLTLGTDGALSARFWKRTAPRIYEPCWCSTVRVPGNHLCMTYHPELRPLPPIGEEQERTVGVWGKKGQEQINRLRIGIVGLGSVGSLVNEALARQGVENLVLIDFDHIERRNLDRIAGATYRDIGRYKVDVAADHAQRCATAARLQVDRTVASIYEEKGYRTALDCDYLFCCVDRPWGRRVLNHIAYAHLIPVTNGGILVRLRGGKMVGTDWHVHTVSPGRRCMECWKAYDPSDVALEMAGQLDNPSYIEEMDVNHPLLRHENVFAFSMNVASLEVLQMASMFVSSIPNLGDQNHHFLTGNMDQVFDSGCEETCLFPGDVAYGDNKVINLRG